MPSQVGDCHCGSLEYRFRNTFLEFRGEDALQKLPRTQSADSLQDLREQKAAYHVYVPHRCVEPRQSLSLNRIEECGHAGFNDIKCSTRSCNQICNGTQHMGNLGSCISAFASTLPVCCSEDKWPADRHNNLLVQPFPEEHGQGLSMLQKDWDLKDFDLGDTDAVVNSLQLCELNPLIGWECQRGNDIEPRSKLETLSRHRKDLSIHGYVTTLLVRNVVCSYSDQEILQILDEMGFKGQYDYIYVPKGSHTHANFGYFFVNFKSPEYARDCAQAIHGRKFGSRRTPKVCEVQIADMQGMELVANIQRKRAKRGFVPKVTWCP